MGYLKQALKVIEEKKNPHRGHSQVFFSNTYYEINEKNEKNPNPKDLQDTFERADSEVGTAYIPGTRGLIQEDYPELWGEIQREEAQINILWLQAREGTGDMGAFREAVDRWKTLHLRAIRFFSLPEGHIRGQ